MEVTIISLIKNKTMTKEDKQLLLVDLCSRLPYRVIVDYSHNAFDVHKGNYIKHGSKCILNCYLLDTFLSPRQNEKGEYIKPYLRPMSDMSEEERTEYLNACGNEMDNAFSSPRYCGIDYLNAHHFDYRELIPKGLAIAVNKNNNPYEKK